MRIILTDAAAASHLHWRAFRFAARRQPVIYTGWSLQIQQIIEVLATQ